MPNWIPRLFWLAALYDGLLGLALLAVPGQLFELCQVTPPNDLGYVQFPAALAPPLIMTAGWRTTASQSPYCLVAAPGKRKSFHEE
jgi:hypothetical protein